MCKNQTITFPMHSFRTCEGFILAVLINFLLTNTFSRKLSCEYSLVMSKDARAKCIRDIVCLIVFVLSLLELPCFCFRLKQYPSSYKTMSEIEKFLIVPVSFVWLWIIAEQPSNPLDTLSSKLKLTLVTQVKILNESFKSQLDQRILFKLWSLILN